MSHYSVDMCGEIPPCAFVPVPDTIVYGVSPIHSSSEMKYSKVGLLPRQKNETRKLQIR